MSNMTKVGDRVKCPKCRGEARVVWVSQGEKTVAIKCTGYHSHDKKSPSAKISSYYKTKPQKKGMVFLIETTKNE